LGFCAYLLIYFPNRLEAAERAEAGRRGQEEFKFKTNAEMLEAILKETSEIAGSTQ